MARNVTEECYAGDLHHYVTRYMLHVTCYVYVYVGLLHVALLQVLLTEEARDAHI